MLFNKVYIPCQIFMGAFSNELVFEFNLSNGESYKSISDRHYCVNNKKKTIPKDFVFTNKPINGYLQAYNIQSLKDISYISIPDGTVVPINNNLILS